jgi:hypothetical protein
MHGSLPQQYLQVIATPVYLVSQNQGFLRLIVLLFSCLTARINESFSKTHLKNYSFIVEKLVSFGDRNGVNCLGMV